MKKIFLIIVCMIVLGSAAFAATTDTSPNSPWIKVTLLNQEPNPARAGDTVDLRFKVENAGGKAAENLNIELVQDYPFTVVDGSAVKTFEKLNAYQEGDNYVTFDFKVKIDKDAVQGQVPIQVKSIYDRGSSEKISFNVNIASKEFAQIIYIDKAKIEPGQETALNFTINNIGNAPLQNMLFSWEEPTGIILPVYSSDTKYIKYLDVGQSVDLSYIVIADVNAVPGLYPLNLKLQSESVTNSTPNVLTTKAGIFVGGETDFEVSFSESTLGQTSLSIANMGNNPAQSVSVKIPLQSGFRVSGSASSIVGNLNKGDYTTVSFQISANGNGNYSGMRRNASQQTAGNNNELQVVIDYTDTTGERRSLNKTVPIQFRAGNITGNGYGAPTQTSFIGSTTFWILLILAVAGIIVFRNKERRERIFKIFGKKK